MTQNIFEIKRQLGLAALSLIKLWEEFDVENNSFDSINETQKELEEATKALKKYKKVIAS